MCARSNMQERIQAMQKAIANADGASKAFLRQQLAVMDGSMKHGQVDFDNAMDASKRILLEAEQEASGLGDVVGNSNHGCLLEPGKLDEISIEIIAGSHCISRKF